MRCSGGVDFLLWIVAVIVAIAGFVRLFSGDVLWGIGLIVVACLIGPGGVSLFC